jgi:hypothetical protein
MIRWTAEADTRIAGLTEGNNAAEAKDKLRERQHQPDEHYGLHNFTVFQSLLKRHLNLQ